MSDYHAPSADPGRLPRGPHTVVLAVVLGVLAVAGWKHAYFELFRQFSAWDDEGTMMSLVRSVLDGGVLFDEVRSPGYGPFYFMAKALQYGLTGSGITHDVNRLGSAAFWIACALGCALLVHRVTRSIVASALTLALVVPHLRCFANEPGHPQELGVLLLVCALLAGTLVHNPRTRWPAAYAIGALAAALFLTKVNAGFFLALAAGLAGMGFFRQGRRPRLPAEFLAAATVALPLVLMLADLGSEWGLSYAVVAATAAAAALLVTFASTPAAPGGRREFLAACGGFATGLLASCLWAVGRGTSLQGLLGGVLLERLSLYTEDGGFVIPAVVGYEAIAAGMGSLALAAWWASGARRGSRGPRAVKLLAGLKLLWATWVVYWVFFDEPYVRNALLAYAMPFAWLLLARGDHGKSANVDFTRSFLCLAAVIHALIAYPVHGSQSLLATVLLIPVAAVCAHDAFWDLAGEPLCRIPAPRLAALRLAGVAVVLAALSGHAWGRDLPRLRASYEGRQPLDLPGAARIRLPAEQAETYRWLVSELQARCDGFFGIPMYPSLYFWTGVEPPVTAFDAWIAVFDEDWEQRAVERMRQYEHPCIVYNEEGQRFWTRRLRDGGRLDSPILRYSRESFATVARRAAYELRVEKTSPKTAAP